MCLMSIWISLNVNEIDVKRMPRMPSCELLQTKSSNDRTKRANQWLPVIYRQSPFFALLLLQAHLHFLCSISFHICTSYDGSVKWAITFYRTLIYRKMALLRTLVFFSCVDRFNFFIAQTDTLWMALKPSNQKIFRHIRNIATVDVSSVLFS